MKRILLVTLLATLSTNVLADGHGYRGHDYHGGGGGNNILLPLIIGGAVGYIIAQPRTVVVQPQQYVPVPSYVPANEPIYHYENVYDANCSCYRQVLVQIN
jgi:hypothetical protein